MTRKILIVEDECAIREMITLFLSQKYYDVIEASDFKTAINKIKENPKLILLDWMLPGRSGIQFIQYIKKQESYAAIPIIMLTAKSTEEDCIACLNAGADDYITKPFSPQILLARIEAVWRRIYEQQSQFIQIDELSIDENAQRVFFQQQEINLSSTEFKLLHFFMRHPEKVYSREQLLNRIWHNDLEVEYRTVDSYIRRLRRNLAPFQCEDYIQTVRGSGYRFSSYLRDKQ
ncbi:phosphate regulon transcriptional regulator PhoB [Haemophilus influenzae]|mgnify:FL=1|uniref:Phosphate regulon transcriptional regulatory protein PhoB n=2 Tax=Haemophilus influenzae TaxID=727 RepID=A0A0D0IHC1_HAEIF|nr:phosphate regulon transcriptional regulator PhoB [Haemophilus influenzae]EDK10546.1 phosphate regulon transcriptional regulatory protein PhoB [Haemophilus influenzae PittHH]AIB45892.1 Phosphate regulon transcriptional regulatory protein PhoB (SphR) [Haemophilus influenzae CGSHiCZ412602]KIP34601.1 chemotaxis protein CheY [Haemophilus influenzae]KIP50038.1 chemotaxis protein CheY [Haemophilus influenzae]KIS35364.1 Phosphate regulon transcriptional regulatory protein phoB [Haemophilus influenz